MSRPRRATVRIGEAGRRKGKQREFVATKRMMIRGKGRVVVGVK